MEKRPFSLFFRPAARRGRSGGILGGSPRGSHKAGSLRFAAPASRGTVDGGPRAWAQNAVDVEVT